VRSPSVSACENICLIVPHQSRPGTGVDDGVGTPIVELDVVLVRCGIQYRRVRTNGLQTVLAVLQQSSSVNDAKHSAENSLDESIV